MVEGVFWGRPGSDVDRLVLRTPADVVSVEAAPPLSHLPATTIYESLKWAAAKFPAKPALIQLASAEDVLPATIDFATYLRRVEQAANLFHGSSECALPVVAVIAPYLPQALIAMWGGGIAGRYVPINPFLELDHVASIMRAAKVNILVTATSAVGPGIWDRLDALTAAVSTLRHIWSIDGGDDTDFDMACAGRKHGSLGFTPATSPDEECAYLHTGGTTATPKLVRHTHGGQLLEAWLCGTAMGSDADAVIGHAMPNFHVGGAIAMGMRGIVFAQTLLTLTTSGFRDPALVPAFWDIVARHGMTSVTTAPTTAAAILAAGGDGPATLRQFTTGGGPQSPVLTGAFAARYGLYLREVWGGTEFHGILSCHYGGNVAPRAGSCGRVVPYHRVMPAILDGNRFVREARGDERGILIATGPAMVPGYVDSDADADFFIENGPDGLRWATTGDVGTVDADGFVWIYGREKDVIIRGGHNIDSATIDEALCAHPDVLFAAAVGKPCPSKGELPMAYVQLRPGAKTDANDILAFVRANIHERAAIPVELVVLDNIPMTAVGKVSKPPLRLDAIRRVAGAVVAAIAPSATMTVAEHAGRAIVTIRAAINEVQALRVAFEPYTFTAEIGADAPRLA